MIDMHSHCLAGVDDGAKTIADSLEMLICAKNNGVTTVAATPHCITDKEEGVTEFLAKRDLAYSELVKQMSLSNEFYPDIVLGAEVYLGCDVSEFSNLDKLCYSKTNYLLVEMPSRYETSQLAEWIYNISVKGIVPVIAHIDRYTRWKEFMQEFSTVGNVVFQINSSSFLSVAGRRLVKNIFRMNGKFIVSSDMHNCTTRPCNLKQTYEIVNKKFPEMSEMLFHKGALSILGNN